VLTELESIGQMYLTKLRQTTGVKRLIERNWSRQDWQDVGQGSAEADAVKLIATAHPGYRVTEEFRIIGNSKHVQDKGPLRLNHDVA